MAYIDAFFNKHQDDLRDLIKPTDKMRDVMDKLAFEYNAYFKEESVRAKLKEYKIEYSRGNGKILDMDLAIKMFNEGAIYKDIAKKVKCSDNHIKMKLQELGYERKFVGKCHSLDLQAKIIESYLNNTTIRDIALMTGVSAQSVRRILEKNDIRLRTKEENMALMKEKKIC